MARTCQEFFLNKFEPCDRKEVYYERTGGRPCHAHMTYGIGLIGSTLEKPRLLLASIHPKTHTPDTPGHTNTDASECKPQIIFSFTIKTAIDCAFSQFPCALLLFKQWSTNHNSWCGIGYSKPYALRHLSLNQMCLPISPIPHIISPLFIQPTGIGSEYEDYGVTF